MRISKLTLRAAAAALLMTSAAAQTPPNDDCQNATPISGLGPVPFDSTGATHSPPALNACGQLFTDVWFEWTAPTTDWYQVDVCAGGGRTQVYASGACPPGTPIACSLFAFCDSFASRFMAQSGQSYLLRSGGVIASLTGGPGQLQFSTFTPAPNDECVNAARLVGEGVFPVSMAGATNSSSQGCGSGSSIDIWFEWSPPQDGLYSFRVFGPPQSTQGAAALFDSCSGTRIECGTNFFAFDLSTSTDYRVRVISGGDYDGSLEIKRIITGPRPPNDDCADSTPIWGTGTFGFNLFGASTDGPLEDACTGALFNLGPLRDVWFDWTVPSSSTFRIETCGLTDLNTNLAVYAGASCPVAAAIDCSNNECGQQGAVEVAASAGDHYLVRVGHDVIEFNPGAGVLRISDLGNGGPGTPYCSAVPNSSGGPALITAAGSASVAADNLSLTATGLPSHTFGLFYFGAEPAALPLGDGTACAGGQAFRLPFRMADPAGVMLEPDFWTHPSSAFALAGSSWNFQCWFRDIAAGMAGFNLSNGLSIDFIP